MRGGQRYLVVKTVGEIEQVLPPTGFCRVHNSFIVNLSNIRKYQKGRGGFVVMEDGTSIEVAARKKDEFLARFKL